MNNGQEPSSRLSRRAAAHIGSVLAAAAWPGLVYLGAVTIAGSLPVRRLPGGPAAVRLVVVVPAHDEREVLDTTLQALVAAAGRPGVDARIVVVADNCTDNTADIARAAGVEVWERASDLRGKGYALRWAMDRLAADAWDAFVVVDADTHVAVDLLQLVGDAIAGGAQVVQGRYDVLGTDGSVLQRLAEASFAVQSVLRQRGRSRLGCAAKLQGNGMAFRRDVLEAHPWEASGQAEDVEYWIELLRAGIRPELLPTARIAGAMPTSLKAARVQRARWEEGRVEVARTHLRPGLLQALRSKDPVLAEALLSEFVLPPLSMMAALVAAAAALGGRRAWQRSSEQGAVIGAHVVAGLVVAGSPPPVYAALALSPAVVAWKVALKVSTRLRPSAGWNKTPR